MGKGGGGGAPPSTQTVTQTNLPEYAKPYFENVVSRAQAESYRPYQAYGGERIAGFSPGQQAVQQEVAGMTTPGQFGSATGLTGLAGATALGTGQQAIGTGQQAISTGQQALGYGATGAGLGALAAGAGQRYTGMATSPEAQQAFMSPYMQNVLDVQKQQAVRDAQQAQLAQNLAAARQGTYGGARQTLAATERERNLAQNLANIQAAGSQKAFEQAQQAMQFGSTLGLQGLQAGIQGQQAGMQGVGQALQGYQAGLQGLQTGLQGSGQAIQAGQTLGQLGTAEQAANLQRLQAQAATGAEQRALQQQRLDQSYADFLRQRDYPMEQLGYFSNILRGLPVQLGSTQTTYAQPPSLAGQLTGAGLLGLGLYREMGR